MCYANVCCKQCCLIFFFFNDTATTEIYTLSLHDALPISMPVLAAIHSLIYKSAEGSLVPRGVGKLNRWRRSEEHTSELQSRENLVCRLLLEKKKNTKNNNNSIMQMKTFARVNHTKLAINV